MLKGPKYHIKLQKILSAHRWPSNLLTRKLLVLCKDRSHMQPQGVSIRILSPDHNTGLPESADWYSPGPRENRFVPIYGHPASNPKVRRSLNSPYALQSSSVQDWHFSVCTRRSAILRLAAVGSSSSERNLCVNFGQAQIRHNGFEEGDILLYFSADDWNCLGSGLDCRPMSGLRRVCSNTVP